MAPPLILSPACPAAQSPRGGEEEKAPLMGNMRRKGLAAAMLGGSQAPKFAPGGDGGKPPRTAHARTRAAHGHPPGPAPARPKSGVHPDAHIERPDPGWTAAPRPHPALRWAAGGPVAGRPHDEAGTAGEVEPSSTSPRGSPPEPALRPGRSAPLKATYRLSYCKTTGIKYRLYASCGTSRATRARATCTDLAV